jgi:hypothetical protein
MGIREEPENNVNEPTMIGQKVRIKSSSIHLIPRDNP